jgi:hypothetical protein
MQRTCHEEGRREPRKRSPDIVFVGQPGCRDRTGCKVAQIPTKTPSVVDAIFRRQEDPSSLSADRTVGGAQHVRRIRASSGRPHSRAKRDTRREGDRSLRAPPPAIYAVGAHRNGSLRVNDFHDFQTGRSSDTRWATRNENREFGICDTGRTDDRLANLRVLHIGRTVADRAHDDVDRRRGVNDNGPIPARALCRGGCDDDDAAEYSPCRR